MIAMFGCRVPYIPFVCWLLFDLIVSSVVQLSHVYSISWCVLSFNAVHSKANQSRPKQTYANKATKKTRT